MKRMKMNECKETTFEEGCEEYLLNCRARNLREGTIKHYKDSMKQLFKYIDPDMLISTMDNETMGKFVITIKNNTNINDMSLYTYTRDLKTLMYFFMKCDYIPTFKISLAKADKQLLETYSDYELRKLLKKPNMKKSTFTEYKSWVIVNFLLSTGIRQRSLINIKIKDIDFYNGVVNVKDIIFNYYFNTLKSSNAEDFEYRHHNKEIYNIVQKIFSYENFEDDDLDSILDWELEVSVDIRKLYMLYSLGNKEIDLLLNKIAEKINSKDKKNFVKQRKVISIFDALNEIEYPNIDSKKLYDVAIEFYQPIIKNGVVIYSYEEWEDIDFSGCAITCTKETKKFIDIVNKSNQAKFKKYQNECVDKAIKSNNLNEILNFPEMIIIDTNEKLDGFFCRAFDDVIENNLDINWTLIFKVLNLGDSNLVYDYISDRIEKEKHFIKKNKLKHIIDALEEESYYGNYNQNADD